MVAEGCSPNLVTYNTLIDVYVKTGRWQAAMALLDAMEAQVRCWAAGCQKQKAKEKDETESKRKTQ